MPRTTFQSEESWQWNARVTKGGIFKSNNSNNNRLCELNDIIYVGGSIWERERPRQLTIKTVQLRIGCSCEQSSTAPAISQRTMFTHNGSPRVLATLSSIVSRKCISICIRNSLLRFISCDPPLTHRGTFKINGLPPSEIQNKFWSFDLFFPESIYTCEIS